MKMYPIDRRKVAIMIYERLQSLRKTAMLLDVCHTTVSKLIADKLMPNVPLPIEEKECKDLVALSTTGYLGVQNNCWSWEGARGHAITVFM